MEGLTCSKLGRMEGKEKREWTEVERRVFEVHEGR